jgi:hypothetical protein
MSYRQIEKKGDEHKGILAHIGRYHRLLLAAQLFHFPIIGLSNAECMSAMFCLKFEPDS